VAGKEETIEVNGQVVEAFRSGMYRVALDNGAPDVLAYTGGRMRKFRIRIVVGDQVKV
jgi:translation initiation factor IF-1